MIILFAAFVAFIMLIVFGAMRSTDVFQTAIARAKADPAVIEALGSPIKDGLFLSGSTNVNGASGEADLAIPISGPKGKGTLYVVAVKAAGEWSYSKMVVEIAGTRERINLSANEDK